MALTLPSLPTYCLSSELTDFNVQTNASTSQVSITNLNTNEVLLSNTYYTYNGSFTVYLLHEIIEDYILRKGLQTVVIQIRVSNTEGSLSVLTDVIYCKTKMAGLTGTSLLQRAVTAFPVRMIPKQSIDFFYYFQNSETISFKEIFYYLDASGNRKVYEITRQGEKDEFLNYQVVKYVSLLGRLPTGAQKLLAYHIQQDQAQATYYFSQKAMRTFCYLNRFLVWETIGIPSKQTEKVETDFSKAVSADTHLQYDIAHNQSFEVETATLYKSLATQLLEMVTSTDIRLYDESKSFPNAMPRVLVSDYTHEISDEPGSAQTVKFTWQFQDRRMRQTFNASSAGIFTEEFDVPFA